MFSEEYVRESRTKESTLAKMEVQHVEDESGRAETYDLVQLLVFRSRL